MGELEESGGRDEGWEEEERSAPIRGMGWGGAGLGARKVLGAPALLSGHLKGHLPVERGRGCGLQLEDGTGGRLQGPRS